MFIIRTPVYVSLDTPHEAYKVNYVSVILNDYSNLEIIYNY